MPWKALFVLLCAPLLSACGGKYKDSSEGTAVSWSGQQVFLQGAPGGLEILPQGIQGTGRVLLLNSLPEAESATSYAIDFRLGNGSELVLVSHGNDGLANGLEVKFRREGAGPGSLKVRLAANGQEKGTVNVAGTDLFGSFDASGPLRFQIDVHNNEPNEAHVVIWDRSQNPSDFPINAAIFDTGDAVDLSEGSPGKGSGVRMGVRLQSALLQGLIVGPPKYEH